jgi:predicted negative regulator of RcsB-dependent stress response
VTGTAFAQPAELGKAFGAYERGDLAAAKTHLAKIDLAKIVNKDYVLWLRGTIALRTDDAATCRTAFEALAKIKGSRFAREVPWRLADCTWAKGDRAGAAKAYAKLVTAKDAGETGDVGTALHRIAETRSGAAAASTYRALLLGYPAHPLAAAPRSRCSRSAAPH